MMSHSSFVTCLIHFIHEKKRFKVKTKPAYRSFSPLRTMSRPASRTAFILPCPSVSLALASSTSQPTLHHCVELDVEFGSSPQGVSQPLRPRLRGELDHPL